MLSILYNLNLHLMSVIPANKHIELIQFCQFCGKQRSQYEQKLLKTCSTTHKICKTCLKNFQQTKKLCAVCSEENQDTPNFTKNNQRKQHVYDKQFVRKDYQKDVNRCQQELQFDSYFEQELTASEFILDRLQMKDSFYRKWLYFLVFVVHAPFALMNILIARIAQNSPCMDESEELNLFILRPWLQTIGLCQISFMIILFLFASFKICKSISLSIVNAAEIIVSIGLLLKTVIWPNVALHIYGSTIKQNCSQGICSFCLISVLFNFLLPVILGCVFLFKKA